MSNQRIREISDRVDECRRHMATYRDPWQAVLDVEYLLWIMNMPDGARQSACHECGYTFGTHKGSCTYATPDNTP
jgi:hypothetical protein